MSRPRALFFLVLLFVAESARSAAPPPASAPAMSVLKASLDKHLRSTQPDFITFVPDLDDSSMGQTGNEHFLVFDAPDTGAGKSLMAVWTQSTGEGQPDQHIVFARSEDGGVKWSKPRLIAGPAVAGRGHIASWAFPLVSRGGRIYVLYSQHIGKFDSFFHTTGRLDGIYSDDNGRTWSSPQTVTQPRTSRDNPDVSFPPSWICWQKPQRLATDGKYLAGISRWTSKAVFKNPGKNWTSHESVVEFIRFENVDDNPPVEELRVTFLNPSEKALTVAHPQFAQVSVCQEPAVVKLPDGRLFCVMRTIAGSPFWSISDDAGETWSPPQRLLLRDGGEPVLHPLSPSPMYDLAGDGAGSGRYVLFTHNNNGHYQGSPPERADLNRRPVYLLSGKFVAGAKQPVEFEAPKLFMMHDDVALGPPGGRGRLDLALYSSLTVGADGPLLWYPDRKFFLLGRRLGQ